MLKGKKLRRALAPVKRAIPESDSQRGQINRNIAASTGLRSIESFAKASSDQGLQLVQRHRRRVQ